MILAVVGMRREAAILARVGLRALVGGGDLSRLEHDLSALLSPRLRGEYPRRGGGGLQLDAEAPSGAGPLHPASRGPPPPLRRGGEERAITALLSFGVAGGLDPSLKAGELVVATGVVDSPGRPGRPPEGGVNPEEHSPGRPGRSGRPLPADPRWAARLAAALPGARTGLICGQDTPVSTAEDKSARFAATGALACDMESHVAAAVAARHGLPFAAIRAISDPAGRGLPAAALAGFGADGEADIAAVLRALYRDPRQLPALIRTGVEAERAFSALRKATLELGS